MDIRLKEDKLESLNNELQDTLRKIKESKRKNLLENCNKLSNNYFKAKAILKAFVKN